MHHIRRNGRGSTLKTNKRNEALINGYCSGSLSDEAFAELEEALRKDPSLRTQLIEYRMLDSDLRSFADANIREGATSHTGIGEQKTIRRLKIEVWVLAAAVAILAVGGAILGLNKNTPETVAPPTIAAMPSIDAGVAVLAQEVGSKWHNRTLRVGDSMPPGLWHLDSGTAEIAFYSGAVVILEGPAQLEITSENGGILHQGKLRADVPPSAYGFTITSKTIELVDLGTSFGIAVGTDSKTEVHVFDGKVELFKPDSGRTIGKGIELLAGEARLVAPNGERSKIPADESRFLSPDQVEANSTTQRQASYERWLASLRKIDQDPRLLMRYDFEPENHRSRALATRFSRTTRKPGAIIGAQWSTGRWPQTGSLDFKRPSDRVRIEVPGTSVSKTLLAWVRVDGLDTGFHSLLLSDGWDRTGAFHWQIHSKGYVELGVFVKDSDEINNSTAPLVMRPADFGRWMQLAVVYDGKAGTVSHYRDGALQGRVKLKEVVPLTIGNAEIGNWTPPPKDSRQIRQFNGRIDEMLIFDEALSDAEISQLHESGKP